MERIEITEEMLDRAEAVFYEFYEVTAFTDLDRAMLYRILHASLADTPRLIRQPIFERYQHVF